MSAYAVSFASYLPPITTPPQNYPLSPLSECDEREPCNTQIENTWKSYENKHITAINVKVISANIDAGALVRPKRRNSSNHAQGCFSLPDDAVRFKLSINFNGRKYTASRSLENFVKLRRNLVKELIFLNSNSDIGNRDNRLNHNLKKHLIYPKAGLVLPELPECNQTNRGISGFTKMQSLLSCYYCPLMECWLKQVMNTMDVDTSSSLNNFLWEPIRDEDSITSMNSSSTSSSSVQSNSFKRSMSVISLSSIHEDLDHFDSDYD